MYLLLRLFYVLRAFAVYRSSHTRFFGFCVRDMKVIKRYKNQNSRPNPGRAFTVYRSSYMRFFGFCGRDM